MINLEKYVKIYNEYKEGVLLSKVNRLNIKLKFYFFRRQKMVKEYQATSKCKYIIILSNQIENLFGLLKIKTKLMYLQILKIIWIKNLIF